jgi:hypothetical protein
MSQRAWEVLIGFIACLIAVVIFVGLVQKTLDTTGTAVSLIGLLGGTVGGLALRKPSKGGDDQ